MYFRTTQEDPYRMTAWMLDIRYTMLDKKDDAPGCGENARHSGKICRQANDSFHRGRSFQDDKRGVLPGTEEGRFRMTNGSLYS